MIDAKLLIVISPTALNHPIFLEHQQGAQLVLHTTLENYKENLIKTCEKYNINYVIFNGANNFITPLAEDFRNEYPNIKVEVM